ncbi:MAG: hypothetical protein ACPGUU_02425 [Flavobacteriaceae bacterium]
MKNLLKFSFVILLTLNFISCETNEIELLPLEQPATVQPNVEIELNDGTDVTFNAGVVYMTDFNPGVPNTTLIVIPDVNSNIGLDGNNNLTGTGKNIKLFLKNASGNIHTEIANAAKNNQYATYTLGIPASGGDNDASYQNGKAIESPSIVDGFAGQVFIGDKIGDKYYIYVNATDPNNPNASIFISLRAKLNNFAY